MNATDDPITIALVDDYDVVVIGVANMLDQYRDRVIVAEIDTNQAVSDEVDIVLYEVVRPTRIRPRGDPRPGG